MRVETSLRWPKDGRDRHKSLRPAIVAADTILLEATLLEGMEEVKNVVMVGSSFASELRASFRDLGIPKSISGINFEIVLERR